MSNRPEDIIDALAGLGRALAGPGSGFAEIGAALRRAVGFRFFSVSVLEKATLLRRVYTSDASLYPENAVKDMRGTGWAKAIVDDRRHLFSPDAAALERAFQDGAAIQRNGLGCAINLRLAFNDELIGSANLLDEEGRYSDRSFQAAQAFAAPLSLLAAMRFGHQTERGK